MRTPPWRRMNDLALSTRRPEEIENLRSPDGDAAFFRRKGIVPLLRGSSVGRIDLRLVWRAFSFDDRAENFTRFDTEIIPRLNEKQWRLGVPDGFAQSLPHLSVGPRLCGGSEGGESASPQTFLR